MSRYSIIAFAFLLLASPATSLAQGVKQNRVTAPIELLPERKNTPETPPFEREAVPSVGPAPAVAKPGPVTIPRDAGITAMPISNISLDTLGLYTEAQGGLPFDAWQGMKHAQVKAALAEIPETIPSPTIRKLLARLLLSSTRPPESENIQQHVLAERVDALFRLGEATQAQRLLEMVPGEQQSEAIAGLLATAHLLSGDDTFVCEHIGESLTKYTSNALGWQALSIYCLAKAGKKAEVQLALDVMHEQQTPLDPAVEDMLSVLAGNKDKTSERLAAPVSWDHAAIAALSGVDILPQGYAKTAPLPIARLIADQPKFADYIREDAALRLEVLGADDAAQGRDEAVLWLEAKFKSGSPAMVGTAVLAELGKKIGKQSEADGASSMNLRLYRLLNMTDALAITATSGDAEWLKDSIEVKQTVVAPWLHQQLGQLGEKGAKAMVVLKLAEIAGQTPDLAALDDNSLLAMIRALQALGQTQGAASLAAEAVVSMF